MHFFCLFRKILIWDLAALLGIYRHFWDFDPNWLTWCFDPKENHMWPTSCQPIFLFGSSHSGFCMLLLPLRGHDGLTCRCARATGFRCGWWQWCIGKNVGSCANTLFGNEFWLKAHALHDNMTSMTLCMHMPCGHMGDIGWLLCVFLTAHPTRRWLLLRRMNPRTRAFSLRSLNLFQKSAKSLTSG